MPYELRLPIKGSKSQWPKLAEHRGMHALFLAALQKANPDLAQAVHEQPTKPFTQGLLLMTEKQQWEWRVTLLDDALYAPFMAGLYLLDAPHLLNRPLTFVMEEVQQVRQSYEELAQVKATSRYALSFHTPTAFKQRHLLYPLPEPTHCFQSWWRRWQAFAPAELGINIALLDIVRAHLVISHFNNMLIVLNVDSARTQNDLKKSHLGRGVDSFVRI